MRQKKCWYRFSYLAPRRPERRLLPYQLRDGDAALFLASALRDKGFDYSGILFNYPNFEEAPAARIDVSKSLPAFGPQDLLVLTTRPPLNDHEEGDRKPRFRSYTTLEESLFAEVRKHLPYCSRRQVKISDHHAEQSPALGQYQNVIFREHGGALIDKFLARGSKHWTRPPEGERFSLAYAIHVRSVWEQGPALLAVFGMGGTETLVWASHLASQHANLIGNADFIMAEIREAPIPESPVTMSFTRQWEIRLLTEHQH